MLGSLHYFYLMEHAMKWIKRIIFSLLTLLVVLIACSYIFLKSETFDGIKEKIINSINTETNWHVKAQEGKVQLALAPTLTFGTVEAQNPNMKAEASDLSVRVPIWALITQDFTKISLKAKSAKVFLEPQEMPSKKAKEKQQSEATEPNKSKEKTEFSLSVPAIDVGMLEIVRAKDVVKIQDLSLAHARKSKLSGKVLLDSGSYPFNVEADLKKYEGNAKVSYQGDYSFNFKTNPRLDAIKVTELKGPNGLSGHMNWENEFLNFDMSLAKVVVGSGGGSGAPLPILPVKGKGQVRIASIVADKYKLKDNIIDFNLPDKANGKFNIEGGGDIDVALTRAASFVDTDLSFKAVPLGLLRTIDPKLNISGTARGSFRGKLSTKPGVLALQGLSGSGSVAASKVVIPNFDVGYYLDFADSLVNKTERPSDRKKDLVLDEITSTIRVNNGELFQDKILGSGDGYVIDGDGRYHLINDQLNYRLNVSRAEDSKKPPLAIRITGSSKNPKFAPDTDAYMKYFLRREVEKQADKLLEGVDEPVKDAIKSIFKF